MARSYLQLYWRLVRGIEGGRGEPAALDLVELMGDAGDPATERAAQRRAGCSP